MEVVFIVTLSIIFNSLFIPLKENDMEYEQLTKIHIVSLVKGLISVPIYYDKVEKNYWINIGNPYGMTAETEKRAVELGMKALSILTQLNELALSTK
jgi:hypothetical protein